ncbi:MAG TPA: phosphotransferase [Acidimicrobiia bacterium]|nr:phosphotransferase [Acidimicrobiia bacterium]
MTEFLARGRMAEVLSWGEGLVLKWFFPEFPSAHARHEASVTDAVNRAGGRAPAIVDVIEWQGRPAIVMERIEGTSLMDVALNGSEEAIDLVGRIMARLHQAIHRLPVGGEINLPQLVDKTARSLEAAPLDATVRAGLLAELDRRPSGRSICHGDLHPGNILLQDGEAVAIDWIGASLGSPHADVARTLLLLRAHRRGEEPDLIRRARLVADRYLSAYTDNNVALVEQIEAWLPILAGARLDENIDDEEDYLIETASRTQAT